MIQISPPTLYKILENKRHENILLKSKEKSSVEIKNLRKTKTF